MQHVTWVAWSQGRVPVGFAHGDADFGTVNKTGGAKTVTLTEAQMPRHDHSPVNYNGGSLGLNSGSKGYRLSYSAGADHGYFKTSQTGGNKPHPNLQPYQVLYIWRRST